MLACLLMVPRLLPAPARARRRVSSAQVLACRIGGRCARTCSPLGTARRLAAGIILMAAQASIPTNGLAQELPPSPGEDAALEDCDRRACAVLLGRKGDGEDLQCQLTKTWPQATIKRAERLALRWKFGDARCSVDLHLKRADIVGALTKPEYQIALPAHRVDCTIADGGQVRTVAATLSPKIHFTQGRAQKIWVNLIRTDGSTTIADFVWLAAKLEDSTGLFHAPMIGALNRYIYERCPSTYPQPLAGSKS